MSEICEKCGTEMQYFHRGSSCGWECHNCGWGIVTTYVDPKEIDDTIYHLTLTSGTGTAVIKAISKSCAVSYANAKTLIANTPLEIFAGKAVDVDKLRTSLVDAGAEFVIVPEWKY